MQLSKEEIQHIAKLARLDLTEQELLKYGGQLSNVLNYIDQLKEVDVKVAPKKLTEKERGYIFGLFEGIAKDGEDR